MKKQVRKVQIEKGPARLRDLPVNAHADQNGDYHFEFAPSKSKLLELHCAKAGISPEAVSLV